MAYYRSVGDVPPKRHTRHRDSAGNLYREELMGEEGFSSDSSLLYHRGVPSALVASEVWQLPDQTTTPNHPLNARHLKLHTLFVAGESVVAYHVAKPSVRSIWTEPDSVEVERIRIEPALRKLVVEFAARCRIDFAALDVLHSQAEGPVFLEANPNGCWWWFEQRARRRFISRHPVTSAVARTLSRLHRTAI